MKILLLGEFSGFHTTLRDGLVALGHDATVVGAGDGSKAIPVDWNIGTTWSGRAGTLARIAKAVHFARTVPEVDVLQIINPHIFPLGWGLNARLLRRLRRTGPRMFLSACGDDALFVQRGIGGMRYNPVDDAVTIDLGLTAHPLSTDAELRWNDEIADLVDGVIPVMREYEIGYSGRANLRPTIPLPVNTRKVAQLPNRAGDKLVVMHGAGRFGFKGTRHVLEAFRILEEKHPGRFEFLHLSNLPIAEYLAIMARVNVVVDQTNSYSCGMNALFAMAMGKVVLGGAEPESLSIYGGEQTPVRNILPDAADIVARLEILLAERDNLPELGNQSRAFVEKHHDYRKVAERYVVEWSR